MHRAAFAGVLVLLTGIGAMAVMRTRSSAGFFSQLGASQYVLNLVLVLVVCVAVTLWLSAKPRPKLLPFPQIVLVAGLVAGSVEILGILVENLFPAVSYVPIVIQIAIFLSWVCVGAIASWRGRSARGGILSAIAAAALCMVIGVFGGEITELYVHPAPASQVSRWGEFKRSHWTDPALFQIANTLDSAATHLTIAPMAALMLGSVGAAAGLAGRRRPRREA